MTDLYFFLSRLLSVTLDGLTSGNDHSGNPITPFFVYSGRTNRARTSTSLELRKLRVSIRHKNDTDVIDKVETQQLPVPTQISLSAIGDYDKLFFWREGGRKVISSDLGEILTLKFSATSAT